MNILKKTLSTTAMFAVTAMLAFSITDVKAETVTSSGTITVQNAFTLAETTALSFGTMVAQNDTTGANVATLAISAAGAETIVSDVPAQFISITPGTNAVYDVTAAIPSTAITVTLPGAVQLVCGACATTPPEFTLGSFVDNSTLGVVTTDIGGAFTLNVGATLTTEASNVVIYEDGVYTGAFDIVMNY